MTRSKTIFEKTMNGVQNLAKRGLGKSHGGTSKSNHSTKGDQKKSGSQGGQDGPGLEKGKTLAALNELVQQEDPDEIAAKRAFRILAEILLKARVEKAKRVAEEVKKAKSGEEDLEQSDFEKRLMRGVTKRNRFIIYPDDRFKQYWDLVMTV